MTLFADQFKQLSILVNISLGLPVNGQESKSLRMVAYKSTTAIKKLIAKGIPRPAVLKSSHAVIVCKISFCS
jgi:hypothetical protein